MEEAVGYLAAENFDTGSSYHHHQQQHQQKQEWGNSPSHTPISLRKRSGTPLATSQSTPILNSKGSWKHSHGGPVKTAVSSLQTEGGLGFTVAAADIPPRNMETKDASWSTSHSQKTQTTSKSTLNPDAREFKLPCGSASNAFSAAPTPMLNSSLQGGGILLPMSLFAVPSMMGPWQSLNGVAEPVFSAERADVTRWIPAASSTCSPFHRESATTTTTTSTTNASASSTNLANVTTPTTENMNNVFGASVPLTPRTLSLQIKGDYASECQTNGYHIVAVFNLEPRTTEAELLTIFFPMGAKKAKLLPPHRSLRPNRRAGVVFFTSKAFAAVAVKKLNDFVPNRQHQPLSVLYCGPDDVDAVALEAAPPVSSEKTSLISPSQEREHEKYQKQQQQQVTLVGVPAHSSQPWRLPGGVQLDRIHGEMWRFISSNAAFSSGGVKHVIAVHGLDPDLWETVLVKNFIDKGAERYEMWPVKNCFFTPTPMPCRSLSAIVWYSQEALVRDAISWFQLRLPECQTQPIDVVHLNSLLIIHGGSMTERGKNHNDDTCENDNNKSNYGPDDVFVSPNMRMLDGVDAFFRQEYDDPKLHLVGVHNLPANSEKRDLFRLFSPHGALDAEMYHSLVQLADDVRASGVVFFDNEVAARKAAEKLNNFTPFRHSEPVIARYLLKPCAAEKVMLSKITSVMTAEVMASALGDTKPNALLLAVAEELHAPVVEATKLTEKMLLAITHSDSTEVMAGQLASVIVCTLTAMKHHAVTLSTPLVNTLLLLHEKLNIPRKGSKEIPTDGETQDHVTARNIFFMQTIARALIQLLMDNTKPHESRKVVAVVCGYLFQFCYLMKSPYELAVKLMRANEASLNLARETKRSGRTSMNPAAFIDYEEEEERKPWLTLMQCLDQMTSLWRQNNKSRAKKDPYRKEYEQRLEEFFQLDACRTGGNSSLNTSARPTPRRVVAKVTPGSAGGYSSSSLGLTNPSPAIPRVSLGTSSRDNNSMVSHDISLDTLSPNPLTPMPFSNDLVSSMMPSRSDGVGSITGSQQQQQNLVVSRPSRMSEMTNLLESMRSTTGVRSGIPVQSVYSHAELMERTVYITKLPCTLRRAQFRRLLLHFGEFNKVRLCRDDNQPQHRGESSISSTPFVDSPPVALWFSFVEFAEPSSAKAMIEYFRNAMFNSQPFSFLFENLAGWPEASHFTPQDIHPLLNARTSPARNPIHDQLPLDAVLSCTPQHPRLVLRNRPCLFGEESGEKTIDNGSDVAFYFPFSSSVSVATTAAFSNPGGSRPIPGACMASATSVGEWQNTQQSSSSIGGMEGHNCDTVDDDIDIESVMNSVVPTVTRNTWMKEGGEAVQHEEQVFSPVGVSWLKDASLPQHGSDPWGCVAFGDEFSTALANASGTSRATDAEKHLWPQYVPPSGNPLIDEGSSDG